MSAPKVSILCLCCSTSTCIYFRCFVLDGLKGSVLQQAGAADRKTEKKKLAEIKGTRRDREAKHGARALQIQRGRSKMFGTAKQSDLRDCIKGTE